MAEIRINSMIKKKFAAVLVTRKGSNARMSGSVVVQLLVRFTFM